MRAVVKSIYSSDAPRELEGWAPKDPENFGISVQAFIGTADSDGVDSFDAVVCTPSWLAENFDRDELYGRWDFERPGLLFGNRFIFMRRWDFTKLSETLDGLCAFHEAADWGTLANRIGRHIPWEFDYKYDASIDARKDEMPRFPENDREREP